LDIANGFPNFDLQEGEMILDVSVSQLFNGIAVGDVVEFKVISFYSQMDPLELVEPQEQAKVLALVRRSSPLAFRP